MDSNFSGKNPVLPKPPKLIEELKAAGEELKKSPSSSFSDLEKSWKGDLLKSGKKKGEFSLGEIAEYPKELKQEQLVLEKRYQEIQELEKKIKDRIEVLKKLQAKSLEINKELKEFQEQMTFVKKESNNLLGEIKNKLKDGT